MAERYRYEPDKVCRQQNDAGRRDKYKLGKVRSRRAERMETNWKKRAGDRGRDRGKSCEMGGGSADSEGLLTEAEG